MTNYNEIISTSFPQILYNLFIVILPSGGDHDHDCHDDGGNGDNDNGIDHDHDHDQDDHGHDDHEHDYDLLPAAVLAHPTLPPSYSRAR